MEKWMKRAGELLSGLVLTNKAYPAVVPYYPQKTEISAEEKRFFKREKPENVGVSSVKLYRMLSELEAEPRANIHSIMIIKDGVVISECSAPGYDVNTWHLSHSMTKSVIGMAVGFLVDDGRLSTDEKLADIFPEYAYQEKAFADISVKHLLMMSTGVKISEAGSVTESEWTTAFFSSKLAFMPGTQFKYNSMNSYILAKIVEKRTGAGIMEFLRPRLFDPLEIKNVFWELSPEGLEKGGWGLYLSAESWAKLGYLMLSRGSFFGKRVLSEKWVKESISTHAITSEVLGDFNYGYQLWCAREGDDFLFNGMLGQNTWISPRNNIVAVITSGNNELFQASPALSIVRKYLSSNALTKPYERGGVLRLREKEKRFFESRRRVLPLPYRRGLKYLLGFGDRAPFDERFDRALGTYCFPKNNQGILPAFVRVMQNNYTGGMESLTLERVNGKLRITSREGGKDYKFYSGFYGYERSIVDFCGEKYMVSSMSSVSVDDNGNRCYKIEVLFPELPNTRVLVLTPDGARLSVKMLETPNQRLATPFLESFTDGNKKLTFLLDMVEKRYGEDFISGRISELFEPTMTAVNKDAVDYEELYREECLLSEEKQRPAKMLYAFVSKFLKNDEEDGTDTVKRSIMSDIFGFLLNKPRFIDDDEED